MLTLFGIYVLLCLALAAVTIRMYRRRHKAINMMLSSGRLRPCFPNPKKNSKWWKKTCRYNHHKRKKVRK